MIMGSPTRDIRNEEAKKLLDYGFANYALYQDEAKELGELPVLGGTRDTCRLMSADFSVLVEKGKSSSVIAKINTPTELVAPISRGDKVGSITYYIKDEPIGTADIYATEDIGKISWLEIFMRMLQSCFQNGG